MSHYVYAYLNPLEPGRYHSASISFLFKPFYIGKGINDRLYDHIKEVRPSRKYKNNYKLNTIRSIQKQGLNPYIIKIYDSDSEKEALDYELRLILELKQRYGLTNVRTSNWSSTTKVPSKKRNHNDPRTGTITIYNIVLGEHAIIKEHQLKTYQLIFGPENIINASEIRFRVGPKIRMARLGTVNGMFGKSAIKGKKWCIVDDEGKLLSHEEISILQQRHTIIYGRKTKPVGKRIIFEGEIKGKYRNDTDISENIDRKYQYGLVWNHIKPTYINHTQI